MSSEFPKLYDPSAFQDRIRRRWLEAKAFAARPDGRDDRYVIMMPLPNVTGALHMGHAMDNVMQDLLIRWHRMKGDNTLWVPGTDHAGIATQAVVEKRLYELEGKTRHDIGREALVKRIWDWKEQYQARIVEQQQRMGCSCDWDRQRFTMDEVCSAAVRETFYRLFKDGLIYRGNRLVNWDCHLKTAVSDDEIYYRTVAGHFWHLRYPLVGPHGGEPEHVVVATTRPETMLGDTAVACHPDPEGALDTRIRKQKQRLNKASRKDQPELERELEHLAERKESYLPQLLQLVEMAKAGRKVLLPLMDREIPLILDTWAKPEMGSGCVKITPAHDPNDYEVWQRNGEIGIINILNPDGTLNENTGSYEGLDRFEARRRVIADLERQGLLGRVEEREVEIGHSDRSKTMIEPYLSRQWFVRMGDLEGGVVLGRGTRNRFTAPGLAQTALDAADGKWRSPTGLNLKFHPDPKSYGAIYTNWLREKRDWCISRQLWWGHRIPIWHAPLDFETLSEMVANLPSAEQGELWIWVAGPEGQQLTPQAAGERRREELQDHELQVCLRDRAAQQKYAEKLKAYGLEQDPDVLDTWFSSALWPHSTLGWPDPRKLGADKAPHGTGEPDDHGDVLSYYYPGSCLVTGRDIITLWVARMLIMGLYNLGDVPFTDCFVHATILDGKGEIMSKSKGNGIDPVAIIDYYGADAMRYLICHMQTGSHYVRLPVQAVCPSYTASTHKNEKIELSEAEHGKTQHGDVNLFTYVCPECKQEFDVLGTMADLPAATIISDRFEMGRNFCTKLWNAARFAVMNLGDHSFQPRSREDLAVEDRWILSRLARATAEVTCHLEAYNPSAALAAAREFFWDELCDWYLEMIKPRFRDEAQAPVARQVLATTLDQVLRLLHPFVPFVTEVIWERLRAHAPQRGISAPLPDSALLVNASWPVADPSWREEAVEAELEVVKNVIRAIRDLKAKYDVRRGRLLPACIKADRETAGKLSRYQAHILNLGGLTSLDLGPDSNRPRLAATQVVGGLEIHLADILDPEAEKTRLAKQRAKLQAWVSSSEKKLQNQKFIEKAPDHVVQKERDKLSELEDELQLLENRFEELDP